MLVIKNAGNVRDNAIADAYGNKFIIPRDFEMLDSAALLPSRPQKQTMLRASFQRLRPSYQIRSITKSSRCSV